MNNMMEFPKSIDEYIKSNSFKDREEIYTNGSELITVPDVEKMLAHYYKPLLEKNEQLENAFNVACKLIYKYTGACPLLQQEFQFSHCENCRNTGADCWEKYCLKVVKNNKLTKK